MVELHVLIPAGVGLAVISLIGIYLKRRHDLDAIARARRDRRKHRQ